ncbi:hypothetical protein ACP70R_020608 [Stipagrostis hirtigluma subsp. patula]
MSDNSHDPSPAYQQFGRGRGKAGRGYFRGNHSYHNNSQGASENFQGQYTSFRGRAGRQGYNNNSQNVGRFFQARNRVFRRHNQHWRRPYRGQGFQWPNQLTNNHQFQEGSNTEDHTSVPQEIQESSQTSFPPSTDPNRERVSRWDITDMGRNKGSTKKTQQGDDSMTKTKNKPTSAKKSSRDSSQVLARINISDTELDEKAGADGEAILWDEADEVYNDNATGTDVEDDAADTDVDQYISSIAELMGLERTERLKITANPINKCEVPTPPRELNKKIFRYEGLQNGFGDEITKGKITKFVVLEPVLNEAPPVEIATVAQNFLSSPTKRWWNNAPPQLVTETSHSPKQLIWARMMLSSEDDKSVLLKADIFRGVLASLYHIPINHSLLAAFLSFWNVESHTLITANGEMGYPLLAVYDSMGLPISGHLYQEFIPQVSAVTGVVKILHSIYAGLWLLHAENNDLVTIEEWVDHFLGEDLGTTARAGGNMPHDFYADPADPLFSKMGFRIVDSRGRRSVRFANHEFFYRHKYSLEVHRAAFLVVWICTYCIPLGTGKYVRPEVFSAAASLAQGTRLAIGTASLAHLYHSIDTVCQSIMNSDRSSALCHYQLTSSWDGFALIGKLHLCNQVLFLELTEDKKSLLALSFLGKSSIRFPKSDTNVRLDDTRESTGGGRRSIRITAIDMLISASVGAVTHVRCQQYHNLVYCPHRFARMHGCDQEVPDFLMEGRNGQFLLQFSTYLTGTRDETIEHLQRRHLAYYSPNGHQFYLQPLSLRTKRSIEYVKWCESSLNFLRDFETICSGQEAPPALSTKAANVSLGSSSKIPAVGRSKVVAKKIKKTAQAPGPDALAPKASDTDALKGPVGQATNDGEQASPQVTQNSSSTETIHATEADVAQVITGKRSSPSTVSHDDKVNADKLSMDMEGSETALEKSPDGSPPKKQRSETSGHLDKSEAILLQAKDEKSSIERLIQVFKDGIGDDFTKLLRRSEPKELKTYEDRSKIVVPESSDPWMQMAIGYLRLDFKKIKGLIGEPVLDKSALATVITHSLERWQMLLQGRDIPKEVSDLIDELKDLKKNLSAGTERTVPISVSTLQSDREHIQEYLTLGKNSHNSAIVGLNSLKGHGVLWDKLLEEVKENKKKHLAKLKELENEVRLVRSELSKEQEREANISNSRVHYDIMLGEVSEAVSNFEGLLAQGSTCLESIEASIQEVGSQGSSNLPAELRLQLKFVESCQIEGAE